MDKELPKNWVTSNIGEVLDVNMGQSPPSSSYNDDGIGIPFMQGKTEFGDYYPKIKKYTTEPKKIVQAETVLLSVRAPIGPTNVSQSELCIGRGLAGISSQILPINFLLYYFRFIEELLVAKGTGTTFTAISKDKLLSTDFTLPPLPEQQRIVAKLDALFAHLEQVKTRLEKIPTLLKNFRQAILTQAVTGKLTEEWREGKELDSMVEFVKRLSIQREEEYQKAVAHAKANKLKKPKKDYEFEFERHSSRHSWCIAKLENLIYMSARIGWKGLKADEYTEKGPLFLSVHGLNYGENVNYNVAYRITQERYDESPEIMLQENDILLCKDGAGIGKLGIVKNLKEPATVNSSLLVIRGREALNYKYLYYFLAGPSLQGIAKERITGTAIPHLFQRDIKEFNLEIPSHKEQTEIVRRVESLFTKADAIEAKYKTLKAQIDNLPQAILAKAFKGELVAQLPTDGNAKDLLKEIQQLKAAAANTKKKPAKRVTANY